MHWRVVGVGGVKVNVSSTSKLDQKMSWSERPHRLERRVSTSLARHSKVCGEESLTGYAVVTAMGSSSRKQGVAHAVGLPIVRKIMTQLSAEERL